jgi:4-diphosphocytidyl-2-C-methyl-D-erythritol kinase
MDMIDAAPHDITLTKNLPVSAGLGGGSANAAAVLRQFKSDLSDTDIAFKLGADVPVCRVSQTAVIQGIGEDLTRFPDLGQVSAVLVNPGVAVSTGAIFKAMDSKPRAQHPKKTSDKGDLLSRALSGTNDMQDAAIRQAPIIADVLRALAQQTGCELARMSGSGATCFGIFRSDAQATAAAQSISSTQSDWWGRPCRLGDTAS